MTDHLCMGCGARLMSDEIALHRKLFSRGAKEYMCLDCQAKYLDLKTERLEQLIKMYRESGTCALFAKLE